MTNSIVLISDEHNPFYSTVYGHRTIHTPNMERLAAEGTLFQHAYCLSPLYAPNRSTFLSGPPNPNSNRKAGNQPHGTNYGKALNERGVYTVYFGKKEVFAGEEQLGFSETRISSNRKHPENEIDSDLQVVSGALQWLEQVAPAVTKPWVLTINLLNPPFQQIRGLRRGYRDKVSFIDTQLGRLMTAVEQQGLRANTNLIYTSDHGEMLGQFGLAWKCSLYEDAVRIPCIAAGPDFAQGKCVQTPVNLYDVQASLFRSVGVPRPDNWPGQPLQDMVKNDPTRVIFSQYHSLDTHSGAYMIRKGDWKLIYYVEAPHQLFHLSADPDEQRNVYAAYPKKAAELEEELRRMASTELKQLVPATIR